MKNIMEESMPVLVSYLKSLADINPTWNHQDDAREKCQYSNTFCDLLDIEYNTTKTMEIQRSNDNEMSLFNQVSDPSSHCPIKIEFSPSFGRYLVATRDIAAGEVLFQEKPLVLAPKSGSGPTCLRCLKSLREGDCESCDGCGAPLCTHSCPGNGHSPEECKVVSRLGLKESRDDTVVKMLNIMLTPLRTFIFVKENPFGGEVLAAMQSNKEIRRQRPIGRFIEDQVVQFLQSRMEIKVESEIVHHICGVFDTNAFEICQDKSRMGRALFPMAAIMNHSCMPNTQHWYNNGVMTVRAVTDIKGGDEVTNTYTPMLLGTRSRTSHLATTKLFRCSCRRCLDPTELGSHISSVACRGCTSGTIRLMVPPRVPSDNWECLECGNSLPDEAVDTMIRAANSAISHVSSSDTEALTNILNQFSRILSDKHYIVLGIKNALMTAVMQQSLQDVTDDDLNTVINISNELLQVASFIDPGISRFRGMLLLEKLKASTEQLSRLSYQNESATETTEVESLQMPPSQRAKMLLDDAIECELILQYDPKGEDAMKLTRLLLSHSLV